MTLECGEQPGGMHGFAGAMLGRELSEAQWAATVASLGMAEAPPCVVVVECSLRQVAATGTGSLQEMLTPEQKTVLQKTLADAQVTEAQREMVLAMARNATAEQMGIVQGMMQGMMNSMGEGGKGDDSGKGGDSWGGKSGDSWSGKYKLSK